MLTIMKEPERTAKKRYITPAPQQELRRDRQEEEIIQVHTQYTGSSSDTKVARVMLAGTTTVL